MITRALLVLGLLLVPALARAQPSSDLKTRAKEHVAAGLVAQDAGRFDDAIAQYRKGYALIPHPEILFNLGQAYRLKGDAARALGYYRRYLAIEPRGRVARDAERWITELAKVVGDGEEIEPEPDEVASAPAGGPADPAPPPPPRPGRTLRIAGLATGAAGAVSIAIGIKLGLDARSISDELSTHDGPWTDALLARQRDGRTAERRMFMLTGVGAAAVIGGAVMYVLGSRMTVTPTPEGLAVAGEF